MVTTTTDSMEEADLIGEHMVKKRLAACAQISGPLKSHFWWKGKLNTATEWQCGFKTSREKYGKLEEAIREMHSYELPQIIAAPATEILEPFKQWIMNETENSTRNTDPGRQP